MGNADDRMRCRRILVQLIVERLGFEFRWSLVTTIWLMIASLVQDPNQAITPFFQNDGATSMASTTSVGASWFVLSNNGNGLADEPDSCR